MAQREVAEKSRANLRTEKKSFALVLNLKEWRGPTNASTPANSTAMSSVFIKRFSIELAIGAIE